MFIKMMSKKHSILWLVAATILVPGGGSSEGDSYCVMSYLCSSEGYILTHGEDLIDDRTLSCDPPKVWCKLKDKEEIKETTTTIRPRTLVPVTLKTPMGPGEPCTAFDLSTGRCLYPHLCANDTRAVDGSDLIDDRSADPCPVWRGAIQICCPASLLPPNITDIDVPTTQPTRTGKDDEKDMPCITKVYGDGRCVFSDQCTADEDGAGVINVRFNENVTCPATKICCPVGSVDFTNTSSTPAPVKSCGKINTGGVAYEIFEGRPNEAKFGEFPWMIAVRTRKGPGPGNFTMSGGSLIHPSVVLTKAKYVVRAVDKDVEVRAGEWDIKNTNEPLAHQDREVKKFVTHPDFNSHTNHNDIALLILDRPFILAPHIGLVCLPPAERAQPSTECVATGWGKDKFGGKGQLKSVMKKTILPVVEHEACQTLLRNTRLGPFYQLHQGFMCAGGSHLDTCSQDGGGPLACTMEHEPDRYMVWGITSWGIGCGENGVPGVYIDVSQYRPWIVDTAKAEGFDVEEYDL